LEFGRGKTVMAKKFKATVKEGEVT